MRWFRGRGGRGDGLVTASEVACFVYCPEQWRLHYGLGLPAENQPALDAGTRHHDAQAAAERRAAWTIRLGLAVAAAALLTLVLGVLSR